MFTRCDSTFRSSDFLDMFKILDDYSYSQSPEGTHKIDQTEEGLLFSLDLPGVKPEDLSVKTAGCNLTVAGKNRGKNFSHSYRISKDYDADSAQAFLEHGVLTVKFSKSVNAETKNIKVNVI